MDNAFDLRGNRAGRWDSQDRWRATAGFGVALVIRVSLACLLFSFAFQMDLNRLWFYNNAVNLLLDKLAVTYRVLAVTTSADVQFFLQCVDHHGLDVVRGDARYAADLVSPLL